MNLLRKYYEAEDRQGGGELAPVIILAEEVWDYNSALIGSDIDDLQYYAGRAVMLEHDFKKSCEQIFKAYHVQLAALQEENRKLREALDEIANPIKYMQNRLKKGEQLNGVYAIQLSKDASYLQGIAGAVLDPRDPKTDYGRAM